MAHPCGEYGGRVLRKFNAGSAQFIPGALLTPEMVEDWPLANRRALHDSGKVDWFHEPSAEEFEARSEGKEKEAGKPKRVRTTGNKKSGSKKK